MHQPPSYRPRYKEMISSYFITSQWCYNERDEASNHRHPDCLLNCLFMRRSKKTSKLCVTGFCEGNHRWQVDYPHKEPVTRKMFPFDDVIMRFLSGILSSSIVILWSYIYIYIYLGLYSLSSETSYRKISWILETARFGFRLFQSLWNLTSTLAAALPICLSNFGTIRSL